MASEPLVAAAAALGTKLRYMGVTLFAPRELREHIAMTAAEQEVERKLTVVCAADDLPAALAAVGALTPRNGRLAALVCVYRYYLETGEVYQPSELL
jgi:hypothetical protein